MASVYAARTASRMCCCRRKVIRERRCRSRAVSLPTKVRGYPQESFPALRNFLTLAIHCAIVGAVTASRSAPARSAPAAESRANSGERFLNPVPNGPRHSPESRIRLPERYCTERLWCGKVRQARLGLAGAVRYKSQPSRKRHRSEWPEVSNGFGPSLCGSLSPAVLMAAGALRSVRRWSLCWWDGKTVHLHS
jgi:hypothetical protein